MNKSLQIELNEVIQSVTLSLTNTRSFNVAIASLMKLSNSLSKEIENENILACSTFFKSVQSLLIMLAPMAPFISEELWYKLLKFGPAFNYTHESVHLQSWPVVVKEKNQKKGNFIIIQFQGRTKGKFDLPEDIVNEKESILSFLKENNDLVSKSFAKREIAEINFLPESRVMNIMFKN